MPNSSSGRAAKAKKKSKGKKLPTPPTSPRTAASTTPPILPPTSNEAEDDGEYESDDELTKAIARKAGSFRVRKVVAGASGGDGPAVDVPTTPTNARRPASYVALFSFTPKVSR